MRVVYLNKVRIEENLPAVNFTLFNAYALAQAGAECFLFVQSSDKGFPVQRLYESFQLDALENLCINIIPQRRHAGIKTNQWFYLSAYYQIKRLHQAAALDGVISRDPGALPYLWRLKKKFGIPVFYQPHNFYLDVKIRDDVNPKNAAKYHLLEARFLPKMSGIFCLQASQASLYKKYLPRQNVQVISPGLIRTRFEKTRGFDRKLIGYVGSMQLKKGVEVLIKTMQDLKTEGYRLLLIGGRNAAELQPTAELVKTLGLSDAVRLPGWVSYQQLQGYLDEIAVGVIPLRDEFYNRYLTAPNKLFDYLSLGVPIVASDLPAIRDFISSGKEGELVAPNEPEALLRGIRRIFKDEAGYNKYRQNAMQTAGKFLWKNQAQIMLRNIPGV